MLRLLVALSLVATTAYAAPPQTIDSYVDTEMRRHIVPGLALVVMREGRVIKSQGFGSAGVRPMTPDTPIIIGSLSKAFTATAVLQLVDAKRISLDAPVTAYLPDFALADPRAAGITVRQLLNQTSGIPTFAARAEGRSATLADHVRALRTAKLVAPPGARHIYASPNYQVLGRLVEVVSGQPFGAYVQTHIFQPLEMTRTFVDERSAERAGLATGHNLWFGIARPSVYRFEADRLPTASIITTANDLSHFVAMHLDGGQWKGTTVLSPESAALAHHGVGAAGDFRYAMGWREGPTAGVKSLWHGGALPSYRSAVVMLPETRSAVIVLTNVSTMFADHTREVASGIVALEHGAEPEVMFRSLSTTYRWIAIIALIILLLQLRSVVRSARLSSTRRNFARSAAIDVVIAFLMAILVPRFTHVPWRAMFEGVPDVTLSMMLLIAMLLLTAGIKTVRAIRAPGAGEG
jgi:CubicO group peptidase (beta-lactamase class C family)